MRFAGRLALLLLVAPGTVHGYCDFASSTTLPSTPTTSTTLPADEAFLQTLLDEIRLAMTLPIRRPVVVTGTASARGRLKAKIFASSSSHADSALLAKGRVNVHRADSFKLKLYPTPTGGRFEDVAHFCFAIVIEVRYRTKAGTQHRTNVIWH